MSQRAIFAAKLLAGEMPQNIEDVFTANGLSLCFRLHLVMFTVNALVLIKQIPVNILVLLYYQLGDRFSEDPFVLFQLRGRTKEQIISDLRQLRSAKSESNTT